MKNGLTIKEFLHQVVHLEIGTLVYGDNPEKRVTQKQKAPYIKFLPIIVCIELLGACLDDKPFNCDERRINSKRFKKGLELFGKRYEKFRSSNGAYSFWSEVRNPMMHQFRVNRQYFGLTTRKDAEELNLKHLQEFKDSRILLILEDLYDDLVKATDAVIEGIEGKSIVIDKPELSGDDLYLTYTRM